MKKIIIVISLLFVVLVVRSQVAINANGNDPDISAMLDVQSNSKGMLIPRMSANERDAINAPATGLMVFITDDNSFYYYNGTGWNKINGTSNNGWVVSGNDLYSSVSGNVGIGTTAPTAKLHVLTQYTVINYSNDLCTAGVASASASSSGYGPENGFDDDNGTYWSNNGSLPAWLSYDFELGNEKTIVRYRIYYDQTDMDHSPKNWRFQGSDDASAWTTLDTRNAEIWITSGWKEYDFTNSTPYRYYRLLVLDNKGTSDNIVSINEMEMMESYTTVNNDNTLFVNGGNVGVGTDSPTTKLHVAGTFRLTDGTEGINKLLISDLNGNASWTNQNAIDDGDWNVLGNHIYTLLNDSVGIGVVTPGSNLDIYGRIWISNTGHSIFIGENAGAHDNFTNNYNVFIGYQTGQENTNGNANTAVGTQALHQATSGIGNTAYGYVSLFNNNTGNYNTGLGYYSLFSNTEGNNNVALGDSSLFENITGYNNTAIGHIAFKDGTSYHNSTAIGNESVITGDNQVRIGNADVTSIAGYVDFTTISDGRFKTDIKDDVPGLDFIMKLHPVTYHLDPVALKQFLNGKQSLPTADDKHKATILQSGFIAQEVEQAAKETGFDFSGVDKPANNKAAYGLRYAQFVTPLVKAVQEQQKIIQQQQKIIDKLLLRVNNLEKQFNTKKKFINKTSAL